MEDDKEIMAMAAVNTALTGLDTDAVSRVLRWVADRYKITLRKAAARGESSDEDTEGGDQDFKHFSDLYDAADPSNDAERVLVAGYWFQALQGEGELESQTLNKELKNTGHAVDHMPHALDDLMSARPRLMIQLKKEGNTRQARRKFKLTTEGVKKVQTMIKQQGEKGS